MPQRNVSSDSNREARSRESSTSGQSARVSTSRDSSVSSKPSRIGRREKKIRLAHLKHLRNICTSGLPSDAEDEVEDGHSSTSDEETDATTEAGTDIQVTGLIKRRTRSTEEKIGDEKDGDNKKSSLHRPSRASLDNKGSLIAIKTERMSSDEELDVSSIELSCTAEFISKKVPVKTEESPINSVSQDSGSAINILTTPESSAVENHKTSIGVIKKRATVARKRSCNNPKERRLNDVLGSVAKDFGDNIDESHYKKIERDLALGNKSPEKMRKAFRKSDTTVSNDPVTVSNNPVTVSNNPVTTANAIVSSISPTSPAVNGFDSSMFYSSSSFSPSFSSNNKSPSGVIKRHTSGGKKLSEVVRNLAEKKRAESPLAPPIEDNPPFLRGLKKNATATVEDCKKDCRGLQRQVGEMCEDSITSLRVANVCATTTTTSSVCTLITTSASVVFTTTSCRNSWGSFGPTTSTFASTTPSGLISSSTPCNTTLKNTVCSSANTTLKNTVCNTTLKNTVCSSANTTLKNTSVAPSESRLGLTAVKSSAVNNIIVPSVSKQNPNNASLACAKTSTTKTSTGKNSRLLERKLPYAPLAASPAQEPVKKPKSSPVFIPSSFTKSTSPPTKSKNLQHNKAPVNKMHSSDALQLQNASKLKSSASASIIKTCSMTKDFNKTKSLSNISETVINVKSNCNTSSSLLSKSPLSKSKTSSSMMPKNHITNTSSLSSSIYYGSGACKSSTADKINFKATEIKVPFIPKSSAAVSITSKSSSKDLSQAAKTSKKISKTPHTSISLTPLNIPKVSSPVSRNARLSGSSSGIVTLTSTVTATYLTARPTNFGPSGPIACASVKSVSATKPSTQNQNADSASKTSKEFTASNAASSVSLPLPEVGSEQSNNVLSRVSIVPTLSNPLVVLSVPPISSNSGTNVQFSNATKASSPPQFVNSAAVTINNVMTVSQSNATLQQSSVMADCQTPVPLNIEMPPTPSVTPVPVVNTSSPPLAVLPSATSVTSHPFPPTAALPAVVPSLSESTVVPLFPGGQSYPTSLPIASTVTTLTSSLNPLPTIMTPLPSNMAPLTNSMLPVPPLTNPVNHVGNSLLPVANSASAPITSVGAATLSSSTALSSASSPYSLTPAIAFNTLPSYDGCGSLSTTLVTSSGAPVAYFDSAMNYVTPTMIPSIGPPGMIASSSVHSFVPSGASLPPTYTIVTVPSQTLSTDSSRALYTPISTINRDSAIVVNSPIISSTQVTSPYITSNNNSDVCSLIPIGTGGHLNSSSAVTFQAAPFPGHVIAAAAPPSSSQPTRPILLSSAVVVNNPQSSTSSSPAKQGKQIHIAPKPNKMPSSAASQNSNQTSNKSLPKPIQIAPKLPALPLTVPSAISKLGAPQFIATHQGSHLIHTIPQIQTLQSLPQTLQPFGAQPLQPVQTLPPQLQTITGVAGLPVTQALSLTPAQILTPNASGKVLPPSHLIVSQPQTTDPQSLFNIQNTIPSLYSVQPASGGPVSAPLPPQNSGAIISSTLPGASSALISAASNISIQPIYNQHPSSLLCAPQPNLLEVDINSVQASSAIVSMPSVLHDTSSNVPSQYIPSINSERLEITPLISQTNVSMSSSGNITITPHITLTSNIRGELPLSAAAGGVSVPVVGSQSNSVGDMSDAATVVVTGNYVPQNLSTSQMFPNEQGMLVTTNAQPFEMTGVDLSISSGGSVLGDSKFDEESVAERLNASDDEERFTINESSNGGNEETLESPCSSRTQSMSPPIPLLNTNSKLNDSFTVQDKQSDAPSSNEDKGKLAESEGSDLIIDVGNLTPNSSSLDNKSNNVGNCANLTDVPKLSVSQNTKSNDETCSYSSTPVLNYSIVGNSHGLALAADMSIKTPSCSAQTVVSSPYSSAFTPEMPPKEASCEVGLDLTTTTNSKSALNLSASKVETTVRSTSNVEAVAAISVPLVSTPSKSSPLELSPSKPACVDSTAIKISKPEPCPSISVNRFVGPKHISVLPAPMPRLTRSATPLHAPLAVAKNVSTASKITPVSKPSSENKTKTIVSTVGSSCVSNSFVSRSGSISSRSTANVPSVTSPEGGRAINSNESLHTKKSVVQETPSFSPTEDKFSKKSSVERSPLPQSASKSSIVRPVAEKSTLNAFSSPPVFIPSNFTPNLQSPKSKVAANASNSSIKSQEKLIKSSISSPLSQPISKPPCHAIKTSSKQEAAPKPTSGPIVQEKIHKAARAPGNVSSSSEKSKSTSVIEEVDVSPQKSPVTVDKIPKDANNKAKGYQFASGSVTLTPVHQTKTSASSSNIKKAAPVKGKLDQLNTSSKLTNQELKDKKKEPLLKRSLFRTKSQEERRSSCYAFSAVNESSVYAFEPDMDSQVDISSSFSKRIKSVAASSQVTPISKNDNPQSTNPAKNSQSKSPVKVSNKPPQEPNKVGPCVDKLPAPILQASKEQTTSSPLASPEHTNESIISELPERPKRNARTAINQKLRNSRASMRKEGFDPLLSQLILGNSKVGFTSNVSGTSCANISVTTTASSTTAPSVTSLQGSTVLSDKTSTFSSSLPDSVKNKQPMPKDSTVSAVNRITSESISLPSKHQQPVHLNSGSADVLPVAPKQHLRTVPITKTPSASSLVPAVSSSSSEKTFPSIRAVSSPSVRPVMSSPSVRPIVSSPSVRPIVSSPAVRPIVSSPLVRPTPSSSIHPIASNASQPIPICKVSQPSTGNVTAPSPVCSVDSSSVPAVIAPPIRAVLSNKASSVASLEAPLQTKSVKSNGSKGTSIQSPNDLSDTFSQDKEDSVNGINALDIDDEVYDGSSGETNTSIQCSVESEESSTTFNAKKTGVTDVKETSSSTDRSSAPKKAVQSTSIAIQCDMDDPMASFFRHDVGSSSASESGTQTEGSAKLPLPPSASPFYYLPLAMAALGEKLPAQLVQQMIAKTQGLVGTAEAGMILQQAAQLAQQHQAKVQQQVTAEDSLPDPPLVAQPVPTASISAPASRQINSKLTPEESILVQSSPINAKPFTSTGGFGSGVGKNKMKSVQRQTHIPVATVPTHISAKAQSNKSSINIPKQTSNVSSCHGPSQSFSIKTSSTTSTTTLTKSSPPVYITPSTNKITPETFLPSSSQSVKAPLSSCSPSVASNNGGSATSNSCPKGQPVVKSSQSNPVAIASKTSVPPGNSVDEAFVKELSDRLKAAQANTSSPVPVERVKQSRSHSVEQEISNKRQKCEEQQARTKETSIIPLSKDGTSSEGVSDIASSDASNQPPTKAKKNAVENVSAAKESSDSEFEGNQNSEKIKTKSSPELKKMNTQTKSSAESKEPENSNPKKRKNVSAELKKPLAESSDFEESDDASKRESFPPQSVNQAQSNVRRSSRSSTSAATRATESDQQGVELLKRHRRAKRAAAALAKVDGTNPTLSRKKTSSGGGSGRLSGSGSGGVSGWMSPNGSDTGGLPPPLSPQMSPDTLRGWPPPRLTR